MQNNQLDSGNTHKNTQNVIITQIRLSGCNWKTVNAMLHRHSQFSAVIGTKPNDLEKQPR